MEHYLEQLAEAITKLAATQTNHLEEHMPTADGFHLVNGWTFAGNEAQEAANAREGLPTLEDLQHLTQCTHPVVAVRIWWAEEETAYGDPAVGGPVEYQLLLVNGQQVMVPRDGVLVRSP